MGWPRLRVPYTKTRCRALDIFTNDLRTCKPVSKTVVISLAGQPLLRKEGLARETSSDQFGNGRVMLSVTSGFQLVTSGIPAACECACVVGLHSQIDGSHRHSIIYDLTMPDALHRPDILDLRYQLSCFLSAEYARMISMFSCTDLLNYCTLYSQTCL